MSSQLPRNWLVTTRRPPQGGPSFWSTIWAGYAAAKLMRVGFQSSNLDFNARYCMASTANAVLAGWQRHQPDVMILDNPKRTEVLRLNPAEAMVLEERRSSLLTLKRDPG